MSADRKSPNCCQCSVALELPTVCPGRHVVLREHADPPVPPYRLESRASYQRVEKSTVLSKPLGLEASVSLFVM